MNWTQHIDDCIEHDSKRYLLKGIPLWLIAAANYEPDLIYWREYLKANAN